MKIYVNEFLKKSVIITILLMPILRYYNVWGTQLGFEALLKIITLGALILLATKKNRDYVVNFALRKSGNWFAAFGIYAVLLSVFCSLSIYINYSMSINVFVVFIISVIIVEIMLNGSIDFRDVFKIYSSIVWLMGIICVIQWILLICGIRLDFSLPTLAYTDSWKQLEKQIFGMNDFPTAVFSEKAHFSEYIIPYIAFCLFSDKYVVNGRIKKAAFFSVLEIMTVSGNAVVLVFVCWVLYFLLYNKMDKNNKVILIVIGLIALVVTFSVLTRIETVNTMLSMLFTNNENGYSKANYRVYRGFDVYSLLPGVQKIFGVGYFRMEAFSKMYNIVSSYDKSWNTYEYFSGFTQVLLYFGTIGFILIFKHIWTLFKGQSQLTKGLIILFVLISLSSEILFQGFHLMFMLLIIGTIQCDDESEKVGFEYNNYY